MSFSLFDATVANYLQTLSAVGGFLEKSRTHFHEKGVDLAEIVETRLAADMLPLRFQIVSVVHHSRGAMEAAKNGVFVPYPIKRFRIPGGLGGCRGWQKAQAGLSRGPTWSI